MQHTQNSHRVSCDLISRNVRGPIDLQFAGSFDTARASDSRSLDEFLDNAFNSIVNKNRGARTVRFDVIENGNSICQSKDRPRETHRLSSFSLPSICTTFGKVCLDLLMGNRGTGII